MLLSVEPSLQPPTSLLFLSFILFILCECGSGVQKTTCRSWSLFLLCGLQGLSSGRQAWWHVLSFHLSSPKPAPLLQVQELQGQWQEEAMKAEKWLFECQNLEEKCDLVTKEKEVRLSEALQPEPCVSWDSPFPRRSNWHLASCPCSGC